MPWTFINIFKCKALKQTCLNLKVLKFCLVSYKACKVWFSTNEKLARFGPWCLKKSFRTFKTQKLCSWQILKLCGRNWRKVKWKQSNTNKTEFQNLPKNSTIFRSLYLQICWVLDKTSNVKVVALVFIYNFVFGKNQSLAELLREKSTWNSAK